MQRRNNLKNIFSKENELIKKINAFLTILLLALASFVSAGLASTINSGKIAFAPQIVASTFSGNGTLFAGDNNYTLYRSDDNGTSFRLAYTFPSQTNDTT